MEINFLTSLSKEKKYGPNQVIFREGEMGNEMYVVLEGRVMISKFIPGAGEEALAFLERGGYFGEMALIDNEPALGRRQGPRGGRRGARHLRARCWRGSSTSTSSRRSGC